MRPRLSVIVTCHDYGHFLEACLNSVAAQSRAAHEVILVDDGSTDASSSIAGGRPPGLIRIEQPNQGQAAAFNAGFARASGEAVLFLDADDVLAPDALEMLGHAWDPGLAAIAYRLDLIDAAGRVAGLYPVAPAGGDLRPALLARGHFRFMPTSGNLFTRACITPAFPLPAARWRISADALLLRAAAMAGPIRVLPLTLGAYRAHGGNAYYRATQSEMAFLRRSLRDMADACRDVADMPAAIPGPDPDAARLDLVLAFLRLRLAAAEQGETAAAPALREVLPRLFQLRLGLRVHAALAFILGLLPALTAVSPRSRRWIVEPDSRPWLVAQAVERLLGSDLAARRRSLQAPRWKGGAGGPVFAPSDWRPATEKGGQVLLRGCGEIQVPVDHMPRGGRLSFALVSTAAYAATPVEVTLSAGGSLLARATIVGAGEIATELDPATTLVAGVLGLRLKARPQTSGLRARLGTALAPSGLIEVAEVLVASLPDAGSGVVLAIGESRDWRAVARACQVAPAPDPATGWPECVEAPRLELAVLPTAMPAELVLRFGAGQPFGSVVASGIAGTLRRAIIGPGSELRVPLVDDHPAAEVPIQVALDFDPEDPFTTPAFALEGLSLSAGPVAPLEPGAEHRFEGTAADQEYLDASWQVDEAGAHLTETHGRLNVAISPAAGPDAELQLVLAPMGGPLTDAALNVAVSDAGAPLAVVALRDQQMMVVPLAEPLRRGARRLELDVHLALAVPGQDASALRRGAVTLLALRLVSHSRRGNHSADMQTQAETLAAEILAAGVAARDLRERAAAEPSEVAALAGTRARIVAAIEVLADKAAPAVLLNRETLDALLDLGAFAATVAESRPRPVSLGIFQDDVAAAARSLSLSILTTPPWQATEGAEVAGLCEALAAFPGPVARYLAATDWAIEDAAAGAYRAHVLKLFAFARTSFAGAVTRPRLVSLAERLLGELRPHPMLFAGAPMREVAEALGEAAAARLVSAGRRLGLPRPARRRTSALRLGVLLRNLEDTPETRICIGTLGVVPPEAVQVTVFVHEASRRPVDLWPGAVVIDLDGLSVDSAVEAIRAESLDLLLLGAFVAGFADLAAIVSHRLAPLQVASTAVAPMTTGLASFDLMLCDAGSMPADGGADYSERLAWSPVPVQRFPSPSHSAADREAARDLLRARLGLAPGAVVLVSGAVEGKIGAELIRTWTQILAAAPEAVLVLYPFAPNWRMRHARGRFVRHLAAACAARSVAADRVRVLDSLSRSQVEDLLSGADLYLDSFPYAGATTVVEALHCSLPAVALAGNTQRGLQGAAWLRAFGLPHLVADDPAGYSARAVALLRDAGARCAAAAAIRSPDELAPEVYGPALARFLRGLAGFPEVAEPLPRHIFHHMPKAAGTTCRDVFASWFELRVDDREPWSPEAPPPRYPPASIAPGEMLCGHFNAAGYSLSARYPEVLGDPGWRLITFLRDPLEAAISYHAFERRHRPRWDRSFVSPDLDAYLEAGPRHLGEHLGSVDDDWRSALERYWFVGTVDRLGECLRWLALALDKPDPGPLPRLNSSDGCGRPSACAVRAFTRCRPEEFEIWRAAAARCARLLASNPRRWRA